MPGMSGLDLVRVLPSHGVSAPVILVTGHGDVDMAVEGDGGGGWDNEWDDHHHPIATGVAFGATAAITSAVIGSMVYTLPPACQTVVVNGIGYSNCNGTWYQPQYVGTSVQYVVVAPVR